MRGKPGEISRGVAAQPLRSSSRERTSGNKYNKGSNGVNDVEWTKSGVSVERVGKMRGTVGIKENEDSVLYIAKRERKEREVTGRCARAKVASSRMKKETERD